MVDSCLFTQYNILSNGNIRSPAWRIKGRRYWGIGFSQPRRFHESRQEDTCWTHPPLVPTHLSFFQCDNEYLLASNQTAHHRPPRSLSETASMTSSVNLLGPGEHPWHLCHLTGLGESYLSPTGRNQLLLSICCSLFARMQA